MKPALVLCALAALALGAVGSASAHLTKGVHVTIRHQSHGCHAWSADGGAYKASLTLRVARGTVLQVTNNDVMPHKLVELSGPRVKLHNLSVPSMGMGMHGPFAAGQMAHMGASTETTLARAGTYHFRTKAGEDYMAGMKTIGEDNVLTLTVVVT